MSYWTEQVQMAIRDANLHRLREADICERLNVSGTTLRRRLREDGTRYSALLEAEKRRRCVEAISEKPDIRGGTLANLIGYHELNSFYRAFHTWFGFKFSELKRDPRLILEPRKG